jgi:hypothetical protein
MLVLQGELFECSKIDTHKRYWDNVGEIFARSLFSGATMDALSAGSTTTAVTVSRAATTQVELCDVSDDGLSAL